MTLIVSARLSPLAAELTAGSALVILAPPGARRRLVEQACENELRGEVGAPSDSVGDVAIGEFLQKPLSDLEDRFDLLVTEVVDRNDMARGRLSLCH
jgi:hypothetical protein